MVATEVLGIETGLSTAWIGGHWPVANESGGYHGLLKTWFDHFGLQGNGLVVGEQGEAGEAVKNAFRNEYGVEVYSVGLSDADIAWDITKPLETEEEYGWIVCQAVLEHVTDPVAAIKNMSALLTKGGRLYVHTCGPGFPYHPYPIDCFRFFRDALVAMAEIANLEIDDMLWTNSHCFAAYRSRADD